MMIDEGSDPFDCIKHQSDQERKTQDMLRLIVVLERALGESPENHQSAIQWVIKRDQIIDNLMAALQGNYKIVLDLVRVLDNGIGCKRAVDLAVDRCEEMLNLRESILIGRVKHSIQVRDSLEVALAFLERYFTLIALCGYLSEERTESSFSEWLKARPEIWNMFLTLRKTNRLKAFLPINKLTGLSKPTNLQGPSDEAAWNAENQVINGRAGAVLVPHTILKQDIWSDQYKLCTIYEGACNFRNVPGFPIFAVAQPRLESIKTILHKVKQDFTEADICWINIREEPLVYIHEEPFVLRDKFVSLRNLRSYSGIPASRLEQMESRLKDDILCEANTYQNQVLIHSEDSEGHVYPVWEKISSPSDVMTMPEIFAFLKNSEFPRMHYFRIPVTAEDSPEPADFDFILHVICSIPIERLVLIFNCQIGAGRSTTGTVIAAQVINWLKSEAIHRPSSHEQSTIDTYHYEAVYSILRTIRYGLESKHAVDKLIDAAGAVVNLRTIINEWKEKAEQSGDQNESRKALRKGLAALKRYCLLLLFQAYLNENPANLNEESWLSKLESFSEYIERHPEFVKILSELSNGHVSLETLQSDLEVTIGKDEGHALTNEVAFVIGNRQGSVLGPLTIMKYDHFPGCQKMSLPERLEGAPNFRQVQMPSMDDIEELSVYGMAMPMASSIKDVLRRMNASPNGKRNVLWISLREEPVTYIKGRPFVLRVVKDPIANLEMTGIISERVESMEVRLKSDILGELGRFNEKILLHEEELTKQGYELVPVWEHADSTEVSTPAEVYADITKDGFKLSYIRIPMYPILQLDFNLIPKI